MTNPEFDLNDYEDIELTTNYKKLVKDEKTISSKDFLKAARKISRDNARTPMQWNDKANAGFTTGKPWFKLNPDYSSINVEKDLSSSKSVFKYYQKLIELRHTNDILEFGNAKLLMPDDEDIFAYTRQYKNQKWLVIANLSSHSRSLEILNKFNESKIVISNYEEIKTGLLRPYEALILQLSK